MSDALRRSAVLAVVAAALAGRPVLADEPATGFRCELKQAGGIPEADAQSATRLLCDELRQRSGGRGVFEVGLGTLGKLVLLTASREDTGTSISVRLEEIEELPTAVPRVASALVEGHAFGATGRVDNLIASETRAPLTRRGSVKFTAGVADVEALGHGARASGVMLGLLYSTPRFALPAELRFGWDGATYDEPSFDFVSFSIGGRAFLSGRDTSPFVGGGLGYLRLHAGGRIDADPRHPGYFDAERQGISPYLEAGVELLRTHRGRLALAVRADVPTGSAPMTVWQSPSGAPYGESVARDRSKYIVPVSIGLTVAF